MCIPNDHARTLRTGNRRRLRLCAAGMLAASAASASRVLANPLDPNAFVSLGTLNPAAGTYTASTSGTPVLTVGGTTYTGVVVAQGGGLPGVAVFTFANVTIGNGVRINA